jgi:hypothetical protein
MALSRKGLWERYVVVQSIETLAVDESSRVQRVTREAGCARFRKFAESAIFTAQHLILSSSY